MTAYAEFILTKSQWVHGGGFAADGGMEYLFPFQEHLTRWALDKGRAAIFADCGLGKTAMQLAWADAVVRRCNRPVLLLTPIAVGAQTVAESAKFGVSAERSRDGKHAGRAQVIVTNYEQLHKFAPSEFAGVVCDESSSIKDFKSARKASVVEFCRTLEYRLLCTATAAPNDFWELGTSAEALGLMGFRDMVTTFFKQETAKDHLGWGRTKYRFRGHAEEPFWAWVCSWARSMRKPSDLGFPDEGFDLPDLVEREHVVEVAKARPGRLFALPGNTMQEERQERRLTIEERVEMARNICEQEASPCVMWCELNDESTALSRAVSGAVEITGSMTDDEKEDRLVAFSSGQVSRLVLKPKIGAWGLNWQHCHRVVAFPSHSYEQYYQAVRRCYRFGQQHPVTVDVIVGEGETGLLASLRRKASQADRMFSSIVRHMSDATHMSSVDYFPEQEQVPSWL